MDTFFAVLIYKRDLFAHFDLKGSFIFKNLEIAEIAYKEILNQFHKKIILTPICGENSITHISIAHIGSWTIILKKNIPIKDSFNKEEVLRDINEIISCDD